MTRGFIYKDYAGEVKYPPDDHTEQTAMRLVKKDIDRIFQNYRENKVDPPVRIEGSDGQVIWIAEYILADLAA